MTLAHKNPVTRSFIVDLEKLSKSQKVNIWQRVAQELTRSARVSRTVNVGKIATVTEAKDTIIVPGKVLASGLISHPVTVIAYQFSQAARDKIAAAGGSTRTIAEETKKNPKGSGLRIIG